MLIEHLRLFGLDPGAAPDDVKKAYRRLAKKNHPDRFSDIEQKKNQEKIMARINEAYKSILADYKNIKNALKPEYPEQNINKSEKENDTMLYKRGVEYFNKYNGSVSLKNAQYTEFDRETVEEKVNNLMKASSCFSRLVQVYPDSDWAYDSGERLKIIEKNIKLLKERQSDDKNQPIPRYLKKFKNIFWS